MKKLPPLALATTFIILVWLTPATAHADFEVTVDGKTLIFQPMPTNNKAELKTFKAEAAKFPQKNKKGEYVLKTSDFDKLRKKYLKEELPKGGIDQLITDLMAEEKRCLEMLNAGLYKSEFTDINQGSIWVKVIELTRKQIQKVKNMP